MHISSSAAVICSRCLPEGLYCCHLTMTNDMAHPMQACMHEQQQAAGGYLALPELHLCLPASQGIKPVVSATHEAARIDQEHVCPPKEKPSKVLVVGSPDGAFQPLTPALHSTSCRALVRQASSIAPRVWPCHPCSWLSSSACLSSLLLQSFAMFV